MIAALSVQSYTARGSIWKVKIKGRLVRFTRPNLLNGIRDFIILGLYVYYFSDWAYGEKTRNLPLSFLHCRRLLAHRQVMYKILALLLEECMHDA